MNIYFAPLQGYTDAVFRKAHQSVAGGVDCYYTPFVRCEKGAVRNKDLRDIAPDNNAGVPVVPQIIFSGRDEFCFLSDRIQQLGWNRIGLNMGCPFPLQVRGGRGSGILSNVAEVEAVLREAAFRPEVQYSVKMRLGHTSPEEAIRLLPLLDEAPLAHIALHPRLGVEQYKGRPRMDDFAYFYEHSRHPLVYNGDISSPSQIVDLESRFPNLKGVMIGRGLLADPLLARAYKEQTEYTQTQRREAIYALHDSVLNHALRVLQGDSQVLARMQSFWDYLEGSIDKKPYKQLRKCGTLKNYLSIYQSLGNQTSD